MKFFGDFVFPLPETWKKKTENGAGWFKLIDGNLFPGQSPRRFFESDRDTSHTSINVSPYGCFF